MSISAHPRRYSAIAAAVVLTGVSACSPQSSNDGGADGSSAGNNSSAVAAAQKNGARADYNPQPYENIKDGGTYTTGGAFSGDDTQGQPWNVNSSLTGFRIWNLYNPVTLTYSPAGELQVNKDYFTDVKSTTSGGNQQVTITINPKATFNDGTPIDWRAVETVWKTNNGKNSAYQIADATGYDRITSVTEGADDKQAVITFKGAYAAWPSLFFSVLHPKLADAKLFNGAYSNQVQNQYGAGPYRVQSYDKNSKRLVLERNPSWWGKKGKLDKRILLDLTSEASKNAYKNGQVDYVATGDAEGLQQIKSVSGGELRRGGSPFQYSLFLNGKSPLLGDVKVRQAVQQAVNRSQIAKVQFQGLDYTEPLPGSNLFFPFQKQYEDNIGKVLQPGTDKAAATLEAAGWRPGSDGIRTKDGKKLNLTYILYSTDPLSKATASALQQQLKAAGIGVTIKTISDAQWSTTINGGRFDLIISGNRATSPYGATSLSGFYGSKNANNITRVGSAAVDSKIAAVNSIADPNAQASQANEVEREALKLFSVLPLYSGPSIYGVKKGLANVGATIFNTPLPETIGWQK